MSGPVYPLPDHLAEPRFQRLSNVRGWSLNWQTGEEFTWSDPAEDAQAANRRAWERQNRTNQIDPHHRHGA